MVVFSLGVCVAGGGGWGLELTDFFQCCLPKIHQVKGSDPFKNEISTKKYNDFGREAES